MRSIWTLPLAVAASLALVTSASAQVDLPLDEYLCYQAKEAKIPTQGKFKDLAAQIEGNDQWDIVRPNSVAKYVSFCNPVSPTPPAGNAAVHLAEYQTKDLKQVTKFSKITTVYALADRLGGRVINEITKPKSLMVRSSKDDYGDIVKCKDDTVCTGGDTCQGGRCLPASVVPPALPGSPVNTADYTCYQVKGPKGPFGNVTAVDQFGYSQEYLMNKITKICAPTNLDAVGGPAPAENDFAGHLICYQAKSTKMNPAKFIAREVAIRNIIDSGGRYLDIPKQTEYCIPALKALGNTPPTTPLTPTKFDTVSEDAGGVCGNITVTTGGVPNRLDPADAEADQNACCTGDNTGTCNSVCTGAGAPLPCCTGVGTGTCNACCEAAGEGHCIEANTITCGSLTFGGGGPAVGSPGGEGGSSAGQRTRYSLSCTGPFDPACVISGNAGDIPNAVNCSTTGCGGVTPIDTTDPIRVCSYNTLGANASGTLNLATGAISLNTTTNATVNINTVTSVLGSACPKCRTSAGASGMCSTTPLGCFVDDDCPTGETCSVNIPAVFATGGLPGTGVCDSDSLNAGAACSTFEPAGDTAGLTSDCDVDAGGSGVIAIGTTSSSSGASVSDPTGHFCGAEGQGGNSDCIADDVPQLCCSGAGMGSCNNFNGCFGSANALGFKNTGGKPYEDITGTCTGIAVTGSLPGLLISGSANDPLATYGAVDCIPAVAAGLVLSPLVNNNAGLPGPVVTSSKVRLDVNP